MKFGETLDGCLKAYLDPAEGLHPLIEVDYPIAAYVDEIEEVLDDREGRDGLRGELAQRDDELVELVEGHAAGVVGVELRRSEKGREGYAYMQKGIFGGQHEDIYVVFDLLELDCTALDDFVLGFP